jgi:hypothetical protein
MGSPWCTIDLTDRQVTVRAPPTARPPVPPTFGRVQHVARLRGIGPVNPAMANANLRRVVEALGYGAVRTVVTSGNVVFDAPARSWKTVLRIARAMAVS